jgi:hypothetical protein
MIVDEGIAKYGDSDAVQSPNTRVSSETASH